MAQFNTLSVAKAASDAESIRSARLQNRYAGLELDERERLTKQREEARKIRQQMEQVPAQIEEMEGRGMFEQADQLRNHWINQKMSSVKMIHSMRPMINQDNYKDFRAGMIQSGAMDPEQLPTEYSENWLREREEAELGDLRTQTRRWGQQGAIMEQDFVSRDGEIVWEGEAFETGQQGGGGSGSGSDWDGMSASDSNSIRRAAAGLYGGFYDPQSGRITGIDPDQQKKAQAISAEAGRIFDENEGRIPHDVALRRAAKKMDIDIPDLSQSYEDPAGLRNVLSPSSKTVPPHMQQRPGGNLFSR